MSNTTYDTVIVGSGIVGAMMAYKLGKAGKKVLLLEAGPPATPHIAMNGKTKQAEIDKFFAAVIKTPGAPYANNPNAEKQISPGVNKSFDGFVSYKSPKDNYWIQTGKTGMDSMYERSGGGTTQHWLGTCLRLLPDDFNVVSKYKLAPQLPGAIDWPITYDEMEPYYTQSENEIGVSGDASVDEALGAHHSADYPMLPIAQSYLDQTIGSKLNGQVIQNQTINVVSTPQGRNSKEYDKRPGCMGNSSCVPICPINAKYDASVHIRKALATGNVTIQYRSVVYQVTVGRDDKVNGVKYKQWNQDGSAPIEGTAIGSNYVLATHAVETPKILLNSPWKDGNTVANSSDQVGRNLMDHICMVTWGHFTKSGTDLSSDPTGKSLSPDDYEPLYPYRGPLSTSGIPAYRNTTQRSEYAAWRIEIGNDGWIWPAGAPNSDAIYLANQGKWGADLKTELRQRTTSQIRMAFELESISCDETADSRVTLSSEYKDALGIPRPQVNFKLSNYTLNGYLKATEAAKEMYLKAGITWETTIDAGSESQPNPGYLEYNGEKIQYRGAGHLIGTNRMGSNKADSVVNADCQSWDHSNLYLVGCGVFPTTATANPTLTAAALALKVADKISG